MTSISDGLSNLIDRMVENDRRLARHTGEYIDKATQSLRDARGSAPTPTEQPKALRSSLPIPFAPARRKMTKKWLEELVKPYKKADPKKFQGITKAKSLSIAGFTAWLVERDIDVNGSWEECLSFPSPLELLAYWRSQGSPRLSEGE